MDILNFDLRLDALGSTAEFFGFSNRVSLLNYLEGAYCLEKNENDYVVYLAKNGQRVDKKRFILFDSAVKYLINKIILNKNYAQLVYDDYKLVYNQLKKDARQPKRTNNINQ